MVLGTDAVMGPDDMTASRQLQQVMDRLEDEAECGQESLRVRIDAETAELKSTMTFSRASAVASVKRETALNKARDVYNARFRPGKDAQEGSPGAKTTSPPRAPVSVSLTEPELAREDAKEGEEEGDRTCLVEENRRLRNENRQLREEASSLRLEVEGSRRPTAAERTPRREKEERNRRWRASDMRSLHTEVQEMLALAESSAAETAAAKAAAAAAAAANSSADGGVSGMERVLRIAAAAAASAAASAASAEVLPEENVPGDSADVQRPALASPEEEISGCREESGSGTAMGSGDDGVAVPTLFDAEQERGESCSTVNSPAPSARSGRFWKGREPPILSPARRRRLSGAFGVALLGGGVAVGERCTNRGSNNADGGGGGRGDDTSGGGRVEDGTAGKGTRLTVEAEQQQAMIEKEAERVYLELKANPPPGVNALIAARVEMDEAAAAAKSTLKDLTSSGIMFGWQQQQQQQQQQQREAEQHQ